MRSTPSWACSPNCRSARTSSWTASTCDCDLAAFETALMIDARVISANHAAFSHRRRRPQGVRDRGRRAADPGRRRRRVGLSLHGRRARPRGPAAGRGAAAAGRAWSPWPPRTATRPSTSTTPITWWPATPWWTSGRSTAAAGPREAFPSQGKPRYPPARLTGSDREHHDRYVQHARQRPRRRSPAGAADVAGPPDRRRDLADAGTPAGRMCCSPTASAAAIRPRSRPTSAPAPRSPSRRTWTARRSRRRLRHRRCAG